MSQGARLFRSKTFRFALVYLFLLNVAVLGILAFVYWSTSGAVTRQIETTIDAELKGLAEQYQQGGMIGLLETIRRRSRADKEGGALYLLADNGLRPLAGNLLRWPDVAPDAQGWVTFRLERRPGEGSGAKFGRARLFELATLHLLVGHDIRERNYLEALMRDTLIWAFAITLGVTLIGALLFSRHQLNQIDRITATSREIMAGDLSRRVPTGGTGDEFDDLAASLNEMLAQIERLLEGMKQVTDNIAHDLRSPLARLRSRLELTLLEKEDAARYRTALQETIEEADQLLATFNALLSIAEAESGGPRERFADVDLAALLEDVADLYRPLAEERGLNLGIYRSGFDEAGAATVIRGDRNLLFQALSNLLDNAVKYSRAGGVIDLSLAAGRGEADFTVADRGPGIPEEQRDRVLERFFRMETSRSTKGSGLGLSLVAAVARLHGGRLVLADNAPGLRARLALPRGA